MKKKSYFKVSLMLFSLFFGAGNLIIPPMAGKMAGDKVFITMAFFAVTAVVLPVMSVMAVSEAKGLRNLAGRVDPVFAMIFTVLIYLSIGPLLGIPRAGSVPFEMTVAPYLPASVSSQGALLLFTTIFFVSAYFLSLSPGKLPERMGKILTPMLLILLAGLFIAFFLSDIQETGSALGKYKTSPGAEGFLYGYNTMDAVAGLNFGFVIYVTLSDMGVDNEKDISCITRSCGLVAGGLLMLIYIVLSVMGAKSGILFPETENGAEILRDMSGYLLGKPGAVLLGCVFTLACLTTSVGLISSCASYFTVLFKERISYVGWVRIWCLVSFLFANAGLNAILSYSVTVLGIIYPVAIVLIFMAHLEKVCKADRPVWMAVTYVTLAIALMQSFSGGEKILGRLPLWKENMAWALPALLVYGVGLAAKKLKRPVTTYFHAGMQNFRADEE